MDAEAAAEDECEEGGEGALHTEALEQEQLAARRTQIEKLRYRLAPAAILPNMVLPPPAPGDACYFALYRQAAPLITPSLLAHHSPTLTPLTETTVSDSVIHCIQ